MRVRSEFDADLAKEYSATENLTDSNRFKLACSMCGRFLYVDKATLEYYRRAIEEDLDNRFVCADCETEADDLAFS